MKIKPNYDKLNFSRTIANHDTEFITSDVCHNYGIMSGCDEGCPALLSGECRNIEDAIECCDVSPDERAEILNLYAPLNSNINSETSEPSDATI